MADPAHATEGDTDLHGDTNAQHWAERFRSKWIIVRAPDPGETIIGFKAAEDRTEGVMLTWFAGAIESGRMSAERCQTWEHRHGGPDAGWYRPGPDGWRRVTDADAWQHDDAAHFMSDPNVRT